jgi:hypothetical protein
MRRPAVTALALSAVVAGVLAARSCRRAPPAPASDPAPVGADASPPRPPKPVGKERLAGKVVGLTGQGLAGLTVSAAPDDGDDGADDAARSQTDADGAFALADLPAGRYRVRVAGEGVVGSEVRRVTAPAAKVVVVVSRAVAVAGVVTDGGIPAPGAAIEVSGSTLDAPRETAAGPDGRFRIGGLPEGRFVVAARRGGRAAADPDVDRRGVGPWPEVALALAPAGALTVRVAGDGAPVAGAWVVLARDELVRRAATDAAGAARFDGVVPGAATVDVVADGFLAPPRRAIAVDAGADLVAAFVLDRGATASGRVVDAAGAPVAGAAIELRGEAGTVSAAARAQRVAWASGKRLAPSRGLIAVGELGVLPGPIPLPPPAGAVTAFAADGAGEPAGFRTAADGTFRVDHVPPGRTVARAAHPDYAAGESAPFVPGVPIEIVLRRGGEVGGRVTDDSGAPVLGAELTLLQAGRTIAVAFVDRDARFHFAHVLGEVVVRAAARGYAPVDKTVRPDEGAVVDVPIALPAASAATAGAAGSAGGVHGEARDAVTRGPLLAFTIAGSGPGGATVRRAFEKGSFALAGLRAGAWKLTVEARGFATKVFAVDVPAGADVDAGWLELQIGATLAGTVYDEHGEAVAGATVTCGVVSAVTDRLGGFRLRGVDPGDVAVFARHPTAGAAEVIVPLRSGDELLTLEIRLSQ